LGVGVGVGVGVAVAVVGDVEAELLVFAVPVPDDVPDGVFDGVVDDVGVTDGFGVTTGMTGAVTGPGRPITCTLPSAPITRKAGLLAGTMPSAAAAAARFCGAALSLTSLLS
jgi:hypothetical protein